MYLQGFEGHTNLRQQEVFLLEAVKEPVEVWSSKVSHRAQSCKQTLARDLLEVTLTDVLQKAIINEK